MHNMSNGEFKIVSALDYASGTADRTGAALDTLGWGGVLTIVKLAAVAASGTNSIKMQQGAAANLSDAADLTGTSIAIADDDDNQIFVIDLVRPQERYVRVYVDKDTSNACAESAIYILYRNLGDTLSTIAVTDAVTYERHVSPAEGTA
jgi:hypothetical protein